MAIHREDVECNRRIGQFGQLLLPNDCTVLTHCNAGALATGGYGTALGVIRAAWDNGKKLRVFADETRPFLQGARLTAWEFAHDAIPHLIAPEGAAPSTILRGLVDVAVIGADRIAANGDVANKVGSLGVALACARAGIPFVVAAPSSTLDAATPDGDAIVIEQRDGDEVLGFADERWAPAGAKAYNPAFDVTPHDLVSAIVTERGVWEPNR